MSKIQEKKITMDKSKKIRTATYALLVAFAIVLSATLIAVNANKSVKPNNASILVSNTATSYLSPMENATVVKDFLNKEL